MSYEVHDFFPGEVIRSDDLLDMDWQINSYERTLENVTMQLDAITDTDDKILPTPFEGAIEVEGMTITYESGRIKVYGTSSSSTRYLLAFNDQVVCDWNRMPFQKTLDPGVYRVSIKMTGHPGEIIHPVMIYAASSFYGAAETVANGELFVANAPVMLGIRCYTGFDYGTEEDPTYIETSITPVAGPNKKLDAKASVVCESVSGDVVSFSDGESGARFKSVKAAIAPVYDLNGYDHPWPAGCGKNVMQQFRAAPRTISGVTFTWDASGVIHCSGTPTVALKYLICDSDGFTLPAGSYLVSGKDVQNENGTVSIQIRTAPNTAASAIATVSTAGESVLFTLAEDSVIYPVIYMNANTGVTDSFTFSPMIRQASVTSDEYEPYANICPITGRTGVSGTLCGADANSEKTFSVSWENTAGEVYYGEEDVIAGVLTRTGKKYTLGEEIGEYFYNGVVDELIIEVPDNFDMDFAMVKNDICSHYARTSNTLLPDKTFAVKTSSSGYEIRVKDNRFTDLESWMAYFAEQTSAGTPVEVMVILADPAQYTDLKKINLKVLEGTNTIQVDSGPVTVEYRADTEKYIDRKLEPLIEDGEKLAGLVYTKIEIPPRGKKGNYQGSVKITVPNNTYAKMIAMTQPSEASPVSATMEGLLTADAEGNVYYNEISNIGDATAAVYAANKLNVGNPYPGNVLTLHFIVFASDGVIKI